MNIYVIMTGLVENGIDNLTIVDSSFRKLTDAVNYLRKLGCEPAKDDDGERYASYGREIWFNSAEYYEIVEIELK